MDNKNIEYQALKLYINYIDMDYRDYMDSFIDDINYIKDLIKTYGIDEARNILNHD